VVELQA
jgi:hypothetical protein